MMITSNTVISLKDWVKREFRDVHRMCLYSLNCVILMAMLSTLLGLHCYAHVKDMSVKRRRILGIMKSLSGDDCHCNTCRVPTYEDGAAPCVVDIKHQRNTNFWT